MNNCVIIIFVVRNCIWYLMKDRLVDYILFRLLNFFNFLVDFLGMEFEIIFEEKLEMLIRFCRFYNVILCNIICEEEVLFECLNNGFLCFS